MAKDKHQKIKDEKTKEMKDKEAIIAIIGLILVVFSILIIANTGFIANALKYAFVFLFGTCYLFVLLYLLFIGFYMIFKKKPFKMFQKMQYVLLFFIFLCVLALASTGHKGLVFKNFTGIYKQLMPKSLNTATVSARVGGGWLGFFLLAVFNTLLGAEAWSMIVYIILLLGLVYLLFYKKINALIRKAAKARKAKKEQKQNEKELANTSVVDRKDTLTGQTLDNDNKTSHAVIISDNENPFNENINKQETETKVVVEEHEKPVVNASLSSSTKYRSLADFDDVVDDLEATRVISRDQINNNSNQTVTQNNSIFEPSVKVNEDNTNQNLFVQEKEIKPNSEEALRMQEYEKIKQEQLNQTYYENETLNQTNNENVNEVNETIQPVDESKNDEEVSEEKELSIQSQVSFEEQYVKPMQTTFTYGNHTKEELEQDEEEVEVEINQDDDFVYDFRTYQLPPLALLKDATNVQEILQENAASAVEKADILMQKMKELNIDAEIVGYSIGPSVTQYETRLNKGKAQSIQGAMEDFKLALGVASLRIVIPIPGKRGSIGIEVPNDKKSMVTFKEIMSYITYMKANDPKMQKMDTIMPIGKDISGNPVIASITKMPHCLISGATNSGKSVCANTIICSLLYQYKPNELKFIMIDPKRVEMLFYKNLPHLLCPIIIDSEHAAVALVKLCEEMQERFDTFSKCQVKNIAAYNEMRRANGEEIMPFIVLVVDEFAELMLSKQSAIIEEKVQSLVQLGRASGIHLILCTQRPSVNVITGTIKNNIPCRLTFRLSSNVDSKTVIDSGGAEKLLNNGDMLLLTPESSDLKRVQGSYISDEEIENIVAFCAKQCPSQFDPRFLDLQTNAEKEKAIHNLEENDNNNDEDADEALYKDIRYFVLKEQTIVTSLIQGKFKIGYGKVSNFISRLTDEGIIGQKAGGKGREVLMTLEEWESNNNEQ